MHEPGFFKLDNSIAAEYASAVKLMEAIHRLRKVWSGFQPLPPLNRSDLMLLANILRLEKQAEKPITVSVLARSMQQSLPGISQKTSTLEKQGYIKRFSNQEDRRVHQLTLTDKGREFARKSLREFLGRLEKALDHLGPDNVSCLFSLMDNFCDVIEDVQKNEGVETF